MFFEHSFSLNIWIYLFFSRESDSTTTNVRSFVRPSVWNQNPQTALNQSFHLTTTFTTISQSSVSHPTFNYHLHLFIERLLRLFSLLMGHSVPMLRMGNLPSKWYKSWKYIYTINLNVWPLVFSQPASILWNISFALLIWISKITILDVKTMKA